MGLCSEERIQHLKIELDNGEYINEILYYADKEYLIYTIGFKTSNNKNYICGENVQELKSKKSPQGYHFTNFKGNYRKCDEGLSSIGFDLQLINEKETEVDTTKFDEFVIGQLGMRSVFQNNKNNLKYLNLLIKNTGLGKDHFQVFEYYNNLCENVLKGELQNKFEVLKDGGNGIQIGNQEDENIHFTFSYGQGAFCWKIDLRQNFNQEQISKIKEGKMAIVAGCNLQDSGFGGEAKLTLKIYDNENVQVAKKTNLQDSLNKQPKFFSVYYVQKDQSINIEKAEFIISGKDVKFWAGYYGPTVSYPQFKVIPIEQDKELQLFNKYIKL
ncbi:hypothetical protein IMG5_119650 [Ichthyophthirius multifiliis]|uniref:Uncharacterized protein n=1 Tax=Ichthyophthirius multifiliis TaxID=5932 RepID=G0QUV6_ICHMU|nr:hypothetical protein IMG5_119650 [Ichthyophthirius multifiliis]EGR30997.1 hypothetical protein IMG5_119650 [Ichthyophthirius multifiliis]|eukprot:XP_004034483.1 hypothetical protein IMG5_119650 [Ichthyophthirius multifiliis]